MYAIKELAYLVATGLFIFSLHWMNDPKTARRGVFAGAGGMLLAILATWFCSGIVYHGWVILAIAAGCAPTATCTAESSTPSTMVTTPGLLGIAK